MESSLHLLAVLGLGAITLWGAIPVGLALGLDPWAVCVAAAIGAALGALAVLAGGDRIRNHSPTPHATAATRHRGLLYRIRARYSASGLGLAAPLFVGAPVGTAMGIILGAPTARLLLWNAGIVFWSAGLTFVATMGLSALQH